MAQIRSKQISDFLSTVNFGTLSTSDKTKIANAADTKLYIDEQIAGLGGDASASIDSLEVQLSAEIYDARLYTSDEMLRASEAEGVINESIDSLEVALAAEISATNSDVTRIDANVSTEKARIDAILLASDADKDSFAEIVSVINAVDLTNDNAVAQVILDLNAEISATNSDFVRVEANLSAEIAATNSDVDGINASVDSLELALSAEISATDADFVSVEGKLSAETSRATAAELVLTNDLASLSTEVVDEVASIDARLGAVSGDLVETVDSLELALSAEIVATNADFTSIDTRATDIETLNNAQNDSIDSLEVALTAEISATNADFVSVEGKVTSLEGLISDEVVSLEGFIDGEVNSIDARISTEKGRIDAILLASDADKDSFAEIVSLINAVDTTNDDAFASYALATNASVDSLEVALAAEISATNADITSIDNRLGEVSGDLVDSVDSLELALTAEISATDADFTSVNARVSNAEDAITYEITAREDADNNLDERITYEVATLNETIDSLETAHDSRLTSLEGYIMEDVQMYVESFIGDAFTYTVANAVQDANKNLVSAFVNGHKVEVSTVVGAVVTLVDPGYVIDEDDNVVIAYQG
jgi:hypothetical protein